MKRRTRVFAGIFALVAMTFALAETVVASTCAPDMDMADMAMPAMDMPAAPSHSHEGDMADSAPATSHGSEQEPGGDEQPRCPLGPLATTQGCVGVASLPGHSAEAPAPSPDAATSVFYEKTRQDLLCVDVLFHPPRA